MTKKENIEQTKLLFEELKRENSHLFMQMDENHKMVDIAMEIPVQEGLKIHLHLNLQNEDELHLSTENIWCMWFPIGDETKRIFKQAVSGLINGTYRIVEFKRRGVTRKSYLQSLENDKWITIYKHYAKTSIPFLPYEKVITVNQNKL